jgi:hypothetical protein
LTCLRDSRIEKALAELHRVTRRGVIFGSVTSELALAKLGRLDLVEGLRRLGTWWEWSELFFDFDFELALEDPDHLASAWQRTLEAGLGPGAWLEDEESLQYCLYSKIRS